MEFVKLKKFSIIISLIINNIIQYRLNQSADMYKHLNITNNNSFAIVLLQLSTYVHI